MKKLLYLCMVLVVISGWISYNYDYLYESVGTSPIVELWNEDYENGHVNWDRPYNRTLHPLKPMHDPEPVIVFAPAPAPAPIKEYYAMAPAPVVEMPVIIVEAKPEEKKIWDNPLINSLVIPLGLYFGKKWIDLLFSKFEKKAVA